MKDLFLRKKSIKNIHQLSVSHRKRHIIITETPNSNYNRVKCTNLNPLTLEIRSTNVFSVSAATAVHIVEGNLTRARAPRLYCHNFMRLTSKLLYGPFIPHLV